MKSASENVENSDCGCGCNTGCEIERIQQLIRQVFGSSGARGIVIGVSGGVDSALATALCCGAVGPEHVKGFLLPTEVTWAEDTNDAEALCNKLGMDCRVIPIGPMLKSFQNMADFMDSPYLSGNLMARIRMTVLYYQANLTESLVCGTSNHSEYMIGYATKYGDDAGDIEPLLHLYKSDVYRFAEAMGVPDPILRKAPSAGLWQGQSDETELGLSYNVIDAALRRFEAEGWTAENETEGRVLSLVKKSMHKRMNPPNLL